MSDIFKGLTGGGWAGFTAWILPSGLILGLFWLLVYPNMRVQYAPFDDLATTEKAFVWLITAVTIGVLLQALSTPLYRLLEGYWWPAKRQEWGILRQRNIKRGLIDALEGKGWKKGLQDEQIARFPSDDDEIAPTRLGNAIRALETYGPTRFELDSQVLWSELCAVVPKYLQTELDRSRATVDFFVALIFLSAFFGAVTIGVAFDGKIKPLLILIGLLSFLSMWGWYEMAIISTSYWASTIQALVNLGRKKLANEMGFELPDSIEAERYMWHHLNVFVYDNSRDADKILNSFRKGKTDCDGTSSQNGNEPKAENGGGEGE